MLIAGICFRNMEPAELQKSSFAYNDYRCNCGKLFFKGVLFNGGIEIKCPRCGQLRSFFGAGKAPIEGRYAFLTTRDGRIINASGSVKEHLRYDPEELLGKNMNEVCGDAISRNANKTMTSDIAPDFHYFRGEMAHQTKKGDCLPVKVSYKYLENNHGGFIVQIVDKIPASVFLNDISSENSAQAEDNFCKHLPIDFMAELDNDGRIIYVSPEIEKILGFRPEEVIGKSVLDYCDPEEAFWRGQNLRRVIGDRMTGHFVDQRLVHKDGHTVDYEACITPLYDDSGEAYGIRTMNWIKK